MILRMKLLSNKKVEEEVKSGPTEIESVKITALLAKVCGRDYNLGNILQLSLYPHLRLTVQCGFYVVSRNRRGN